MTWARLESLPTEHSAIFDEATVRDLPPPAQRFLRRALPLGTPLVTLVELQMRGEIRLGGRWLPFEADQILRGGVGFVWRAAVGGRVLRFSGYDRCGTDGAELDFRLHGVIPVARASGPDTTRSAGGRLVAETVAWLPQALVPINGARWVAIDDRRASVTLPGAGHDLDVEVAVDEVGRVRSIGLLRWSTEVDPPDSIPFGALLSEEFVSTAGVTIAGTGSVGWGWDTPGWPDGEFFRFSVTAAHHRTA